MKRGEVWWHEPADSKPRPVLILTRDEAIGHLFDVIAVPATGTIRGLPTGGLAAPAPVPPSAIGRIRRRWRSLSFGPRTLWNDCLNEG